MPKDVKDAAHVERVPSYGEGMNKDHVDYSRVDKEIAQYAGQDMIEVDEETSKRLRRMIDKRVLVIMILTYFLQALDKGTMSFSSIMGIREYAGLENGQKVVCPNHTHNIVAALTLVVLLAHDLYLHRRALCRIPYQLDHPASPYREIPRREHHSLGCSSGPAQCLQGLP